LAGKDQKGGGYGQGERVFLLGRSAELSSAKSFAGPFCIDRGKEKDSKVKGKDDLR